MAPRRPAALFLLFVLFAIDAEGSILLIGGQRSRPAGAPCSIEWHNPWNSTENGLMDAPSSQLRTEHVSAVLQNGTVLIAGGSSLSEWETLSSAVLFDPVEETWTPAPSMSTKRRFTAAAVMDGVAYICGGINADYESLSSCERFQSGVWEPIANMSQGRYGLALAALNGTLYAMGGKGKEEDWSTMVESYDIITDTWTQRKSMRASHHSFEAAVLGESIIVCGGTLSDSDVCEKYDVGADTWTSFPPMNKKECRGFRMVALDNRLVVLGGYTLNEWGYTHGVVEMYDPITKQWTVLPQKLLQTHNGHSAVVF